MLEEGGGDGCKCLRSFFFLLFLCVEFGVCCSGVFVFGLVLRNVMGFMQEIESSISISSRAFKNEMHNLEVLVAFFLPSYTNFHLHA